MCETLRRATAASCKGLSPCSQLRLSLGVSYHNEGGCPSPGTDLNADSSDQGL